MKKLSITLIFCIVVIAFLFTACTDYANLTTGETDITNLEETPTTIIDETANSEDSQTNSEDTIIQNNDEIAQDTVSTNSTDEVVINEEYVVQALVSLNVREEPNTSSTILGVLDTNETVYYIEEEDNWYKVLYDDEIAYVSLNSKYSRLKNLSYDYSNLIEEVIDVGMSLLGTPYEYGSTRIIDYNFDSISSFTGDTFDCSAFVQYCFYIGANVNLYGDTRTMSSQGTTIDFDSLERGDVIFMTSTDRQYNTGIERIGHVAIYLGNNQILHTYGTGGVKVQDFSSFWVGRFITAKRMI
jgi:cell wall-associated NlpC family hydrolase